MEKRGEKEGRLGLVACGLNKEMGGGFRPRVKRKEKKKRKERRVLGLIQMGDLNMNFDFGLRSTQLNIF